MKKKLMLLGGSRYLIPVIQKAHELGIYTITADYLPNNIAHKYADEYVNVSVVEKEEVLKISKDIMIDGIMSFACDPGVVTAAYVAEKMGLPHVADYKTVNILQNKDLFRDLLRKNGFNVPWGYSFSNIEEIKTLLPNMEWPAIVKPVDSAGSKGCFKVERESDLYSAVENALKYSREGRVIIEEYIECVGDPTDCECFSVDGDMVCITFSNQKFDYDAVNPFTPAGFSFPSNMNEKFQKELISQLQRLSQLLDLKTSIYNFEARVGKNRKAYIMELSPRGGGNRLAEMVRYTSGIDLIDASVRAALGMKIENIHMPEYVDCWYEHILHTNKDGIYENIRLLPELEKYVVEEDVWVKPGDKVNRYTGANETIGTVLFKFNSKEELERITENISEKIEVLICEK